MQEKILHIATEMFLNYGFKSVTMDDIADNMGISKKTIYAHYSTKNKLVQASGSHLLKTISEGIDEIRSRNLNPVIENFEIKQFVNQHLKGEKTSPHFQLKKYYPKVFDKLIEEQFQVLENCVGDNISRGIQQGYYRKQINVPFVCRIHFVGMMGVKDKEMFPTEQFTEEDLTGEFLNYHLRAICTPKGIKTLEEYINNEK
ncbi:TetR/AcrR family transcriptional regulator [Gramella sp. MT6]|uniref:TetR/AcrR family transcriptional regulator n=1 Tax=Gramella sp. MT6 TaxID=2705471 RepID=UPI001C5F3F49|nr:TetR/AcrR family transcriptional regulator [Gramella sp. MT6]QYA25093.1 TetR/AcrR family transcriptional regulator [Gramella sp. MT6]